MFKPMTLTWLMCVALGAGAAMAQSDGDEAGVRLDIQEWEVPFDNGRPRDPWVDAEGLVWFVGQQTHYVGRFTPESGEFERFPLEAGTGPHTVVTTAQGVWYAGNRAAHLGRLDPASGELERFAPPGDGPRDVHSIAVTGDGNLWFTEQGGNRVGYFDTRDQAFTMHEIPGVRPNRFVAFDTRAETWSEPFEIPSGGGTVRHMVYDEQRDAIWFGTDENTLGRAQLE